MAKGIMMHCFSEFIMCKHSIWEPRKKYFFKRICQTNTLKHPWFLKFKGLFFPFLLFMSRQYFAPSYKGKYVQFYLLQNSIELHHILDMILIFYILSHVFFFLNGFEDGGINKAWANGVQSNTTVHEISCHLWMRSRRPQVSVAL